MAMAGSGPNINQWSARLACQIVKAQFGDLCEGVVSTLIRKGRQTLPELLRHTQLQPALLRQVLLVLMQQNCVHTYLQPEEELVSGRKPSYYLYEAQLGWILQSIRMPKFLVHIVQQWGEDGHIAEALVDVLLEHGRLRLDQIVPAAHARLASQQAAAAATQQQAEASAAGDGQQEGQGPDAAGAGPSSAAGPDEDTIRRVFFTLVARRYMERCPPCGLPPPVPSAHPLSAKGRKSSKSGSGAIAESQADALRTLARKRYLDERFTIPADLALAEGGAAQAAPADAENDVAGDGVGDVEQLLEEMDVEGEAGAAAGSSRGKGGSGAGPSKGSKRVRAGGALGAAGAFAGKASKRARRDDALAVAAKAAAAQASEEEEEEGFVVKRRSKKGARGPLDDEEEEGDEEDAAAAEADEQRESGRGTTGGSGKGGKGAVGKRRKGGAGGTEGSGGTGVAVLWRVNFEEFNRVFRHSECVKVVLEKDDKAATVLAAMLLHGARFETTLQEDRSVPMSVMDVMRGLETLQDQGRAEEGWTIADVEGTLQQLAADGLGIVSEFEGGPAGSSFCVNMLPILETARHQQLQAVVRDRFGKAGLRIFNMLIQKGQLEQKQIADFGMLPAKETRELLYKMLKAGYLALQDIPKSSERLPVRTIYTWRVSLKDAYAKLADELYRAAGNVQARYTYEVAQQKELLDIVEEATEAGTMNFNWTQSQRKALTRLQNVANMLQTSLLRLDDQIALFNEY